MAKGFARLGILFAFLLIAKGASAATVADSLVGEISASPPASSDRSGAWFEIYRPTGGEIKLHDVNIRDEGNNRYRIESDLLILPDLFLTLARNRDTGTPGAAGSISLAVSVVPLSASAGLFVTGLPVLPKTVASKKRTDATKGEGVQFREIIAARLRKWLTA